MQRAQFLLSRTHGFTVVELLVVLSIVSIMSTLAINNMREANASLSLRAAASDLETALREAQLWGKSGGSAPTLTDADSDRFDRGFGMFLTNQAGVTASRPAGNSGYVLYVPSGTDNTFVNSRYQHATQVVKTILFDNGVTIRGVCVGSGAMPTSCSVPDKSAHIVFRRPNANAIIFESGVAEEEYAIIELVSPRSAGLVRRLIVESSGLIYIQDE